MVGRLTLELYTLGDLLNLSWGGGVEAEVGDMTSSGQNFLRRFVRFKNVKERQIKNREASEGPASRFAAIFRAFEGIRKTDRRGICLTLRR